ncbi:hypothetical protein [Vibrio anguillarum]|uniref:Uncharacterized protein n=1 Tax=Vibrio anguillarum TaxID=55601 RepID=A0A7U6FSF1_VIBAN|nr:hypothetical protein [Vibrio anguillarum]AZS26232.1 hypothetical protein DYL72_15095 [Vibrio anguillarum]AZS26385.1 hypothetical protein DYL72_15895 [Vibrio anguillarum]MBF4374512.1 hypothetical protein [Vibrio anguillarum]
MNDKWCYSFDGSNFSNGTFETDKLALADAQREGLCRNKENNDEAIKHIFIAPCRLAENKTMFPDADLIIEHMNCQAEDIGGQYASSYPDVSDEETDSLTIQLHELLEKWCEKCQVFPTFFTVHASSKYDLHTLKPIKQ